MATRKKKPSVAERNAAALERIADVLESWQADRARFASGFKVGVERFVAAKAAGEEPDLVAIFTRALAWQQPS